MSCYLSAHSSAADVSSIGIETDVFSARNRPYLSVILLTVLIHADIVTLIYWYLVVDGGGLGGIEVLRMAKAAKNMWA